MIKRIQSDLKRSLMEKDILRVSTLRLLIAAIKNKEIELGKKKEGVPNDEIIAILRSEIKKRKDAAVGFRGGRREDDAVKEEKEMKILQEYLPEDISDYEIREVVKKAIKKSGASSAHDFGKAMKETMAILKGKASGDKVAVILKEELGV
ncbi:MAG: hypothetical protein A2909_02820 [Candidatus Tagabacteria bacterium RIFCSPLOWO2_01_FULL_39_11]|uniref:Glutamyl-tRNA amidotransferase n=1 Tax=Candidatus Tagabacteria bacterium RIFCSPLOWO2_01_FULL_39_11 TaxID=1802295 RepID=A0A1G2LR41_9BACT|nr:MAG: hypothetical protein A2909_02820 [Candidatus Tagabacteria bacterium RIFCSPLOWO2_01_FULL_39_11]